MALTPTIQVSVGQAQVVSSGTTPDIDISQLFAQAVANFPTEEVQTSTVQANVITGGTTEDIQIAMAQLTIVAKGRVDDPKVRVWTYTLDGHDYYVLRLGNVETLVYDTYSGQWSVFASNETDLWKAFQGINWIGADWLAQEHGSNVVVGDDGNGSLYFLNPEKYVDDNTADTETSTYERVFQGQLPKRGYDYEKCFAVELLGSIGDMDNATLTDVTLYISDDEGETYTDVGTVTISNGDRSKRVDWRSLGSFTAPGRLFKIVDTGALHRIDSLTADTDRERGNG